MSQIKCCRVLSFEVINQKWQDEPYHLSSYHMWHHREEEEGSQLYDNMTFTLQHMQTDNGNNSVLSYANYE